MKNRIKKMSVAIFGLLIGAINGFFGAGGGLVAVPLLKKLGISEKEAHANAVAVILPITVLSAAIYVSKGQVAIKNALPYIPTGLIGAFIGTAIMKKISPQALKKIFSVFMIYAGIRLLMK